MYGTYALVMCRSRKVRVKCNPDDTIGDLKKLLAAQTGESLRCAAAFEAATHGVWAREASTSYKLIDSCRYSQCIAVKSCPVGRTRLTASMDYQLSTSTAHFNRVLCAAGTRAEKIRLQKWHIIYKDHITLEVRGAALAQQRGCLFRLACTTPRQRPCCARMVTLQDYEVHDGFGFELFYH